MPDKLEEAVSEQKQVELALSVGISYARRMYTSLRHLNALRAFEAAARHCSIARAAEELNVSHSVVSQHVRNLEQWFGTDLFTRRGNRIALTSEGRQFETQVAHGLQILTDACEDLLKSAQTGTLVISAEPALASRWLRRRISLFCEAFPRIDCHLRSDSRAPEIGEDQVDIVIHFEERIQRLSAASQRLIPVDAYPVCAPALYDKLAQDNAPFWDAPLVHDNGRHIWQSWFAEHEKHRDAWSKGKVYSDLRLAIGAAVDGEGVFLADDIVCQQELTSGSLRQIDPRKCRCTWYRIATAEDLPAHSPALTFRDWLVDQVQTSETM